jgi:hypothetical protein
MSEYEEYCRQHPATGYSKRIREATGCRDEELGAVEQVMRDRFATLDHLHPGDFNREARVAYCVLKEQFGRPLPQFSHLNPELEVFDDLVDGPDGQKHAAHMARCLCCDERVPGMFIVYQLKDQNHFHLQCASCGTSYCPPGNNCGGYQ